MMEKVKREFFDMLVRNRFERSLNSSFVKMPCHVIFAVKMKLELRKEDCRDEDVSLLLVLLVHDFFPSFIKGGMEHI
jgi:hypothetical protein